MTRHDQGWPDQPPSGPPPGPAGGSPPPAGGVPPPGWYPDPTGRQRWWDGRAWGPAAPAQGGIDDRTVALLAHLSFFVFSIVGPLLCYLLTDRSRTFARDHAREALNFQISFMLVWMVGIFGGMFVVFPLVLAGSGTGSGEAGAAVGIGFVALWLVLMGTFVAAVVVSIVAAVRAWRWQPYRYPLTIRFVRA